MSGEAETRRRGDAEKEERLELHVFVTEVRGGHHVPLAQWQMHPAPERRPIFKENASLAWALIMRLAKFLAENDHPACRVAVPISEPPAAVRPLVDTLESSAAGETSSHATQEERA